MECFLQKQHVLLLLEYHQLIMFLNVSEFLTELGKRSAPIFVASRIHHVFYKVTKIKMS